MVLENIFQHKTDDKSGGIIDENPSDMCETTNSTGDNAVEAMDVDCPQYPAQDGQILETFRPEQNNTDRITNMNNMRRDFLTPHSEQRLTQEIIEEVDKEFSLKAENDLVSRYSGTNWLDDSNIDAYLELIKLRNQANNAYPRIYRFDCVFYALLRHKNVKDSGYETVKDVARGDDIFSYDLVFFPCEIKRHWRMVVMDNAAKTICLYDSLSSDSENIKCLKNISLYLKREYLRLLIETSNAKNPDGPLDNPEQPGQKKKVERGLNKKVKEFFSSQIWTVKIVDPSDIPRQGNSNDCGVFLLQFAEYLSRRMTFDFTQVHMPHFRYKMAYETIIGKLVNV